MSNRNVNYVLFDDRAHANCSEHEFDRAAILWGFEARDDEQAFRKALKHMNGVPFMLWKSEYKKQKLTFLRASHDVKEIQTNV